MANTAILLNRIRTQGHDSVAHHIARRGVLPSRGYAVPRSRDLERVLEAYLEAGGSPNAVNDQGYTPLHLAAARGDVGTLRILLSHGANVRFKTLQKGDTALYVAAYWSQPQAVQLLLEHGSSATEPNDEGKTPADVATTDEITRLLLGRERPGLLERLAPCMSLKTVAP